jgi:predicted nuclease of predicted toxin-antitoxin system
VKLLLDMNLPPRWVVWLSAAGHEAWHWRDIGSPAAPDIELLAHARAHGLIVLTHDLDFGDILAATGGDAPSVIQLRTGSLDATTVRPLLLQVLRDQEPELRQGTLITLDVERMRLRMLPLRPEG